MSLQTSKCLLELGDKGQGQIQCSCSNLEVPSIRNTFNINNSPCKCKKHGKSKLCS